MATSKKLTQATAASSVLGTDIMYVVVDPGGTPASRKVTVKALLESNATANVNVNGHITAVNRVIANSFTVSYNTTPASASAVPSGFSNNTIWSDGSYLYVVTGASALKRVAIATW